jgi:hypothetical protein
MRNGWASSIRAGAETVCLSEHGADGSSVAIPSGKLGLRSGPATRFEVISKRHITIDEILEALCELDGGPREPPGGKPCRLRPTGRLAAV